MRLSMKCCKQDEELVNTSPQSIPSKELNPDAARRSILPSVTKGWLQLS